MTIEDPNSIFFLKKKKERKKEAKKTNVWEKKLVGR